jgi:hypothetical protein
MREVGEMQDHRQAAAAAILSRLIEVLGSDEHVIPLKLEA